VQSLAARAVRDDGAGSSGEQQGSQGIAVVGAIGGQTDRCRESLDQVGGDGSIATLAGCYDEGDEAAQPVDQGVQLGGRTAAGSAYGVG
jgi:hypothetical protein